MKKGTSVGCRSRCRERRLVRTDADDMGSSCSGPSDRGHLDPGTRSYGPRELMLQLANQARLTRSR
jgi:hypothetical protein